MANQHRKIIDIDACVIAFWTAASSDDTVPASLRETVTDVIDDVETAWPTLVADKAFSTVAFFQHVGGLLRDEPDPLLELPRRCVTDLALAFGCLHEIPAAIAGFDKQPLRETAPALRRAGASESQVDDTRAQLCTMLLVRVADKPARISQFTGRGSLKSWLRVIALREWKRVNASTQRETLRDSALFDRIANALDPHQSALKESYRQLFRQAFDASLASLSMHDRLVLQQYFLDELSIDKLATLHDIHRATAARWVASIMEKLMTKTKAALGTQLGISSLEIDSVMRMIRSSLDISLGALAPAPRRK
jgi:RNA polymerase sigma-70 factor, ECF subfamily